MAQITVSTTHIGTLGLQVFASTTAVNGTTPFASDRILAAVGSGLSFWNGTAWVTLESGDSGDFTTVNITPTATGVGLDVIATATTTGKGVDMSDLNALTTGKGIHVASSATAITGAGRLFLSAHSGVSGTSAILNEFSTAAADETVLVRLTASAALALGTMLDITGAAVTTGTLVDMGDADALTTGLMLNMVSNSASAGTRTLVQLTNDNVAAVNTTPLAVKQDAPTSTNYFKVATFNGFTLWAGNGTTPNGNLTGTAGDWCIGGDSGKGYFCTGTTSWTAFA